MQFKKIYFILVRQQSNIILCILKILKSQLSTNYLGHYKFLYNERYIIIKVIYKKVTVNNLRAKATFQHFY